MLVRFPATFSANPQNGPGSPPPSPRLIFPRPTVIVFNISPHKILFFLLIKKHGIHNIFRLMRQWNKADDAFQMNTKYYSNGWWYLVISFDRWNFEKKVLMLENNCIQSRCWLVFPLHSPKTRKWSRIPPPPLQCQVWKRCVGPTGPRACVQLGRPRGQSGGGRTGVDILQIRSLFFLDVISSLVLLEPTILFPKINCWRTGEPSVVIPTLSLVLVLI